MRIDSHQHFWNYDPIRDRWITDDMKRIRRDFMPGDLMPILKENSFDGCVAVQTDQSEKETAFLLGLADHHAAIKGVVGWVDLQSDRIEQRLEHYFTFPRLKGFRHIVQAEEDTEFLLQKNFSRGVGLLNRYGFTYDLLIYPKQLPAALTFIERFPELKIVIDHLAKPPVKSKQIDAWAGFMEKIARHQNVFCKLSGLVTEADWKTWQYGDLTPFIEVVVDNFGMNRVLYGSDWPVCLTAATYREQLAAWEKYFRTFLDAEQEAVFGNNAVAFYNLS